MKKGKIIFLNGVSSSGKTTISKSLQERLTEPYYWIAGDTFVSMLPEKYLANADIEQIETTFILYYQTIKTFSDMGINVIADHVFNKSVTPYRKCLALLNGHPVLFVHVTCPLEELRRREKERADRPDGCAENLLSVLWPQDTYDITIDTHNETLDECVDRIIAALKQPDNYSAFKTLWLQHSE